MARQTRRLWTDEEKRSICLQTTAPGVSVAQVALRYTVNANLIFKWLRDPKYRPAPRTEAEDLGRFLWPSAQEGKVALSPAQLSMLLEGIDWRAPQRTWRPLAWG